MPLHCSGALRALVPSILALGLTQVGQALAETQATPGQMSDSAPAADVTTDQTTAATAQSLPSSPDARLAELEAQLRARDAEIATLTSALDERRASAQARIDERIQRLREQIPVTEGGNLTPETARANAEADMRAFEGLLARARGIDNPELWRQIRDAENKLHHSQFLLARAEQARTVYRLRPTDSLPGISMLFYGDPERWPQVLDANRHILADPQQLPPGVTLVIP